MRIAAREFRNGAEVNALSGNLDEAIRLYKLAIQNDPIVSDYLGLGDVFYKKAAYSKAVDAYGAALKIDTKLAAAHAARGDAYREQHKAELIGLAVADYHDAISANPDYAPAYNGLGNLALDDRKYEKAIAYYTTAIEHDPRFAIAYSNLGIANYQIKNYDASIANCKDSIKYDSNRAVPHTCLGNAYWNKGLYDDALTEYHQAEHLDETDAAPTNGVGNVYSSLKNDAKAIEQYRLALKKNDDFALPYNGLGNIAYRAGQYQQAVSYFDQATKKTPKLALVYSNLGNAKFALGDNENALVDFETAIRLDDKLAAPYLGRGKVRARNQKWAAALKDFEIAANLDPNDFEARLLQATARMLSVGAASRTSAEQLNSIPALPMPTPVGLRLMRAYGSTPKHYWMWIRRCASIRISQHALALRVFTYFQMQDFPAAVANCDKATASAKDPIVYLGCGMVLAITGDIADATLDFNRLGQMDSPALFHYGKATLLLLPEEDKDVGAAIAEMDEAIKLGTGTPVMDGAMLWARANLYVSRGQTGDNDLAQQDYKSMIELAPSAAAYKARGDFFLKLRNYDKAIDDFTKATDIAPKFTDAHRALGQAYLFSGRSDSYDQALKSFEAAIASAPQVTDYFYVGQIYRLRPASGQDNVTADFKLAIDNYTKALDLDPHFIEAFLGRALAHQSLDEKSAALGDFSGAVKADPKDIAALDWRAHFYESIGDYAKAIADIDRAIEIAGASSDLFNRKGSIYLEFGDADSAVTNFDLALNASPTDDWPDYFNRGTAYLDLEQYSRAIQDFSETLKLIPNSFQRCISAGMSTL